MTGPFTMGEAKDNDTYQEELLDYEEEEEIAPEAVAAKGTGETVKKTTSRGDSADIGYTFHGLMAFLSHDYYFKVVPWGCYHLSQDANQAIVSKFKGTWLFQLVVGNGHFPHHKRGQPAPEIEHDRMT
eukprot:Gb_29974 [translate_table: standard]